MAKIRSFKSFHSSKVTVPQNGLKIYSINQLLVPFLLCCRLSLNNSSKINSINTAAKTVNKFEGTAYYQESHVVENYLDEFQT